MVVWLRILERPESPELELHLRERDIVEFSIPDFQEGLLGEVQLFLGDRVKSKTVFLQLLMDQSPNLDW